MEGEYYKTQQSVEEYIRMAEGHNGGALIKKLNNFLPHGASLLEIGSGPGTDLSLLNAVYNVVGSDNSDKFIKHLQTKNPEGEFLNLDAATLDTNQKFDGIYSNKVLHHLKDDEIEASIIRQKDLLNPGGIIGHSFWKGNGAEVFNGLFVNYHTESSLKSLFTECFEILLVDYYKEFEENDSLFLIGRKK